MKEQDGGLKNHTSKQEDSTEQEILTGADRKNSGGKDGLNLSENNINQQVSAADENADEISVVAKVPPTVVGFHPVIGLETPTMQKAKKRAEKKAEFEQKKKELAKIAGPTREQAKQEKLKKALKRRRNSKKRAIIFSVILLVLLLMLPSAMAKVKKIYLRKHPDKYYADSVINNVRKGSKTFEISANITVKEDASDRDKLLAEFINNMRFVSTISRKKKVEGTDMYLYHTNRLQYVPLDAQDLISCDIEYSNDLVKISTSAGNIVLEQEKPKHKRTKQEEKLYKKELKKLRKKRFEVSKDEEVQKIVLDLFKDVDYGGQTDEEYSGAKCDVLSLHIKSSDLWQTIARLVKILDSNEALNEWFTAEVRFALEYPETLGVFGDVEVFEEQLHRLTGMNFDQMRVSLEDGTLVERIQKKFDLIYPAGMIAFAVNDPDIFQTVYASDLGVVRISTTVKNVQPVLFPAVSVAKLKFDLYKADLRAEGEVEKEGDSYVIAMDDLDQNSLYNTNEHSVRGRFREMLIRDAIRSDAFDSFLDYAISSYPDLTINNEEFLEKLDELGIDYSSYTK